MSLSKSRYAYKDCYALLDKAVGDPMGVRIQVDSGNAGIYLRMRLHQARQIDRNDNRKTYESHHPMYGRSPYDTLVIKDPAADKDGNWWIVIFKPESNVYQVESLSDGSNLIESHVEEPKLLPKPEADDLIEPDDLIEEAPATPTLRRI